MELQKTIIGDLKTRMDRILTLIAIFWTVVIVGAFAWDYRETYSTAMTIAKSGLKDSFNKDTVYRLLCHYILTSIKPSNYYSFERL